MGYERSLIVVKKKKVNPLYLLQGSIVTCVATMSSLDD